jgi:hypothetical protein
MTTHPTIDGESLASEIQGLRARIRELDRYTDVLRDGDPRNLPDDEQDEIDEELARLVVMGLRYLGRDMLRPSPSLRQAILALETHYLPAHEHGRR